mgnify:CR=1 FL=1
MPFEYNKLKGRIVEMFGSQGNFADKIGLSENSVSRKLNCKIGFSQSDMVKWGDILGISQEEYADYFFN